MLLARELIKKLTPLHNQYMRAVVLAESLAKERDLHLVEAIALCMELSLRYGNRDATLVLWGLADALEQIDLVPYTKRRTLYTVAKRRGYEEVAWWFFDASPTAREPKRDRDDPLAAERPLTPRGRPLTLGERKALARSNRREILEKLMSDPHPDVVSVLLENPHMTEPDVIAIASRRPSTPEALHHIAVHERWIIRHAVRRAVVLNPFTPILASIRAATMLRLPDLREIVGMSSLPLPLRRYAETLVEKYGN